MMNRMITMTLCLAAGWAVLGTVHAWAGPFAVGDGIAVPISKAEGFIWLKSAGSPDPVPYAGSVAPAPDGASRGVLDLLDLPGEFGFATEHLDGQTYFDGLAYRASDALQFEATWDYDDRARAVQGLLEFRLNF